MEKDRNGDAWRKISIKFFKNFPTAVNSTSSLDIYCGEKRWGSKIFQKSWGDPKPYTL